jgi:hypothetical protein
MRYRKYVTSSTQFRTEKSHNLSGIMSNPGTREQSENIPCRKTVMTTNKTNSNGAGRDTYALRLRQLSDAELREEWRDYRRRYDPLRSELAIRKLAARDLQPGKLSHLIGNQRMRETVSKLKQEMESKDETRNAASQ